MATRHTDAAAREAAAAPIFRPRRLGHVNLMVRDIDRMMAFYIDVVGIEEEYRNALLKTGFVGNGNTHHDIGMVDVDGPVGQGRQPGLNHLGFELECEVDLIEGYERARAAGVAFVRTADHDVCHSVYGADPDGNVFELYADVIRDWRAHRSGTVSKPKANWKPGDTPPNPEPHYTPDPVLRRNERAPVHPRRTTHAVLVVEDYAGAVRSFTTLGGLRPLAGGPDTAFAVLGGTCNERSLGLFRARPGRRPGLHHFGMLAWDEDDLAAATARLRRAGVAPEFEIDHPARRCLYLRDPNGNLVQLYVDRDPDPARLGRVDEDLALFLA